VVLSGMEGQLRRAASAGRRADAAIGAPEVPAPAGRKKAPAVPAEQAPEPGTEGAAVETPEVPVRTSGGSSAPRIRKSHPGTSARNNGRRGPEPKAKRSAEETRSLAAAIRAEVPGITNAEVARRLGISDRRLREIESPGRTLDDQESSMPPANGARPDLPDLAMSGVLR